MDAKEIIRQVRRIEIKTRKMVDETLAGQYHSAFKGQGMEFSEVRAYQAGDDIRAIDWNVTARSGGEPFIKKFAEERELTVMILADMSGSQEFGSSSKAKRDLAAELTALFSFSAIRNQDKVGCLIFTDQVELFVPPKKGKKHVLRLVREILAFEPKRVKTDIGEALSYFSRIVKRKAVVFLISDFLDQGYEKPLRFVRGRHDLVAIPLVDPRELEPPQSGLYVLEDGETGHETYVDFGSKRVREAYIRQAKAIRQNTLQTLKKSRVDTIPLECGEDYDTALMNFFKMREMRR
ncbi:DUF58 domain-containing protein [Acanthopleuribacter pedis]|uniref:DUF58 domain-containing protein n=1 Tax=Acanthopleuribacter pedis TaxID=442870 RepID=A0A8J7U707_9BACT|nr:DUF58 domain-containing protein [Acanthopleuribacter pedis]MBO1323312.1 DUF58 domain-containing protein [Acanthopleuribacter pedis]